MRVLCIAALVLVASAGDSSQFSYNDLGDTGCSTGPTQGLRNMAAWLEATFSGQPWWGSDVGYVRVRTNSLHCAGRAIDWVMDGCKTASLAEGNRIVNTLIADNARLAKAWGVQTIIFRGRIWSSPHNYADRAYTVQGVGYTCSKGATDAKTQSHWDHVHLDLNIWGSRNFPGNALGGGPPGPSPTPAPATGHACTNNPGTCETTCASPKRTIVGKCPNDPANVLCCYTPVSCGQLFCPGDFVVFQASVNLRQTPSTSGVKVRATTVGETAEVIAGPTNANGYDFWNLRVNSGSVWAARGDNWFIKYPGVGNLDTPPAATIVPLQLNTTVYSDICVEGTTRNVTQTSFVIVNEPVELCGKQWYEVEVTGDTNQWYIAFDNETMVFGAGDIDSEGDGTDSISAAGRALPVFSLVVAVLAIFAVRV